MSETVKMDQAGRVVIPRSIRARYGLDEGSHRLEVRESSEGILLRPKAEDIPAERHASGWVVFRSSDEESIDPVGVVDEERERRHRQLRDEGDSPQR